jgi:hypothetical protein
MTGDHRSVRRLLAAGANGHIRTRAPRRDSPLHLAARLGFNRVLAVLLTHHREHPTRMRVADNNNNNTNNNTNNNNNPDVDVGDGNDSDYFDGEVEALSYLERRNGDGLTVLLVAGRHEHVNCGKCCAALERACALFDVFHCCVCFFMRFC